jgi:hypothetical protein
MVESIGILSWESSHLPVVTVFRGTDDQHERFYSSNVLQAEIKYHLSMKEW